MVKNNDRNVIYLNINYEKTKKLLKSLLIQDENDKLKIKDLNASNLENLLDKNIDNPSIMEDRYIKHILKAIEIEIMKYNESSKTNITLSLGKYFNIEKEATPFFEHLSPYYVGRGFIYKIFTDEGTVLIDWSNTKLKTTSNDFTPKILKTMREELSSEDKEIIENIDEYIEEYFMDKIKDAKLRKAYKVFVEIPDELNKPHILSAIKDFFYRQNIFIVETKYKEKEYLWISWDKNCVDYITGGVDTFFEKAKASKEKAFKHLTLSLIVGSLLPLLFSSCITLAFVFNSRDAAITTFLIVFTFLEVPFLLVFNINKRIITFTNKANTLRKVKAIYKISDIIDKHKQFEKSFGENYMKQYL